MRKLACFPPLHADAAFFIPLLIPSRSRFYLWSRRDEVTNEGLRGTPTDQRPFYSSRSRHSVVPTPASESQERRGAAIKCVITCGSSRFAWHGRWREKAACDGVPMAEMLIRAASISLTAAAAAGNCDVRSGYVTSGHGLRWWPVTKTAPAEWPLTNDKVKLRLWTHWASCNY